MNRPAPTNALSRSSWHLRAGAVVLAWVMALLVALAAHPFVPEARWLLVHLLTLGVLGTSVLVWSWHFAGALLRLPLVGTLPGQVRRLAAFTGGAVVTVVGVVGGVPALVVAGGAVVVTVLILHAVALVRAVRSALPGRFAVTLRFLVAAALLLAVGVGAGVTLGSGALDGARAGLAERVLVAHTLLNVVGWLGLTVVGTLLTLWPTIVRARIPEDADRRSRRLLPVAVTGVLLAAASALAGVLLLTALGLSVAVAGLAVLAWPYRSCRPAIAVPAGSVAPSAAPAALPVLAGLAWLVVTALVEVVRLAFAPDWERAADAVASLTPAFLVGFAAQVLVGALTFLLPVVLGGGPAAVRASIGVLSRGWAARLVLLNGALVLCLLPVPAAARVSLSVLVVGSLGCLPVLALIAVWRHRSRTAPAAPAVPRRQVPATGQVAAALAVVLLAVAGGVGTDPAAAGIAAGSAPHSHTHAGAGGEPAPATGRTTEVTVAMQGMRFLPDAIEVPRGDRLLVHVRNDGDDRHDLVLDTGARTPRLAPGAVADLDAGVIGGDVEGWCSLTGHRRRGMTLHVRAVGEAPARGPAEESHHHHPAAAASPGAAVPDPEGTSAGEPVTDADLARALSADVPEGFHAREAALPPATPSRLHRVTLDVREVRQEVAPGVVQTRWTFGGQAPGPTLRGRVGDRFEVTLRNQATSGHSIDFHAGALAPDGPMRTIQPGESLVYRFTAERAGVWMYHCSTMPMSLHLANGMYGAVVIDPPGLAPVDREYLLVQSEIYPGPQGGTADDDALRAERPGLVVFNGYARQYDHRPLVARAGERLRLWVLDAGPQRGSAFHVVGGQFDTVWTEGAYRLRGRAGRAGGAGGAGGADDAGGAQVLPLVPAQGGFVELVLPEAGRYAFVTHAMVDAERGAHGLIAVS